MWYRLTIGRLSLCPQSGMFLFRAASPCVKDKLADIVERTIQTEPAEAAQFNACSPELGWHFRAVLLSQSRWAGACPCALAGALTWPFMSVFSHRKPGGHRTDCMRWPPCRRSAANESQQRNSGAPFCIYLSYSRSNRRSSTPCSILSHHQYKHPGWKQKWE